MDVIFALDYSKSMDSYLTTLNNSVSKLQEKIKQNYSARFAEVDFLDCGVDLGDNGSAWKDFTNDSIISLRTNCQGTRIIDPTNGEPDSVGTNEGTHVYYTLKKIAEKKLNYSKDGQKTIILLGNDDNYTNNINTYLSRVNYDCNGDTISRNEIAENLKLNGFQTIFLYNTNSNFEKIIESTHGGYFPTKSFNFQPDSIVKFISKVVNNRYYIDFCFDKDDEITANCNDTMQVVLSIKKINVKDSTNTIMNFTPQIVRSEETIRYDSYFCPGNDINISFSVDNYCENDSIKEIDLEYTIGDSTLQIKEENPTQKDGLYTLTIPYDSELFKIKDKIDYKIYVKMKYNTDVATSPNQPNISTWTIPLNCNDTINEICDFTWNCEDSTISINSDDIINTSMYLMYANYDNQKTANEYTYIPLKMEAKNLDQTIDNTETDICKIFPYSKNKGDEKFPGVFSAKIPIESDSTHIAYYIYAEDTTRGYKAWYGNGTEIVHDKILTLDECKINKIILIDKLNNEYKSGDTIELCSKEPITIYIVNNEENKKLIIKDINLDNPKFTVFEKDSYKNKKLKYKDTIPLFIAYNGISLDNSVLEIINNSKDNIFKLNLIGDNCKSLCVSTNISNNPLKSERDTISFSLIKHEKVKFAIYESDGTILKYNNKEIVTEKEYNEGEYSESLTKIFELDLFSLGLNPLKPYILVISSKRETVMMYVYFSRIK